MTSTSQDRGQGQAEAIKALLIKSWRERWSDVQFGIQIKSLINRGTCGDTFHLSDLILEQALIGPSPNALIIGFLKHSLAAHVVTYSAMLVSITKFTNFVGKPHCVAQLIQLINLAKDYICSRSKSDDCVALATAVQQVQLWLFKLLIATTEASEKHKTVKIHQKNQEKALHVAWFLVDNEFCQAMLYIAKYEDKDTFNQLLSAGKSLMESSKCVSNASVKQKLVKLVNSLKSLDLSRSHLPLVEESDPKQHVRHVIQPLLAFESILSPTADTTVLSQHLYALALMRNLSFSELVYQILSCSLASVSQNSNIDSLKWDAFIFLRLPKLLDKLAVLMRVDTSQLKTPTDMYHAFDNLLQEDTLLNSIDAKSKCNIIKILLGVVAKTSSPLMTETEMVDVEKKRQDKLDENPLFDIDKVPIPESIIGHTRNVEMTLKAEDMMDKFLKSLDSENFKPESMESILGIVCHIIKEDTLDLLLATASASGRIGAFVKSIVKLNQHSQESQGESVKISMLRAALFDATFLLLVHVIQNFGSDVILQEASGTFIETWVSEMLLEDCGRHKPLTPTANMVDNPQVDNLLQQLHKGELRTQVVKWQNVCSNIHLAMKEMVMARQSDSLPQSAYLEMVGTACSRLCSLPICIATWFLNFNVSTTGYSIDISKFVSEFFEIIKKEELMNGDMPHTKVRMDLMRTILRKMEENVGRVPRVLDNKKNERVFGTSLTKPDALQALLTKTWHHSLRMGALDIDSVWKFHDLFRSGGASWFVSGLIQDLLDVVYRDDLEKAAELVVSLFHLDLEQCTLALLSHVLPAFLQNKTRNLRLTDPHGTILAKVLVSCLYSLLLHIHLSKPPGSADPKMGQKRPWPGGDEEGAKEATGPSSKLRKISSVSTLEPVLVIRDKEASKEVQAGTSAPSLALTQFLSHLHTVCQERSVNPVTFFAVRLLEQAASLRSKSSGVKSRLILQHVNIHFITHLIRVLPNQFSMSFVCQLLDSGTNSGRKHMARALCLLRSTRQPSSTDFVKG